MYVYTVVNPMCVLSLYIYIYVYIYIYMDDTLICRIPAGCVSEGGGFLRVREYKGFSCCELVVLHLLWAFNLSPT